MSAMQGHGLVNALNVWGPTEESQQKRDWRRRRGEKIDEVRLESVWAGSKMDDANSIKSILNGTMTSKDKSQQPLVHSCRLSVELDKQATSLQNNILLIILTSVPAVPQRLPPGGSKR